MKTHLVSYTAPHIQAVKAGKHVHAVCGAHVPVWCMTFRSSVTDCKHCLKTTETK